MKSSTFLLVFAIMICFAILVAAIRQTDKDMVEFDKQCEAKFGAVVRTSMDDYCLPKDIFIEIK